MSSEDETEDFEMEVIEYAAVRMDPKVDIPIHLLGFATDVFRACADLAENMRGTLAMHANWRMHRAAMIESTRQSIEMLNAPPTEV